MKPSLFTQWYLFHFLETQQQNSNGIIYGKLDCIFSMYYMYLNKKLQNNIIYTKT